MRKLLNEKSLRTLQEVHRKATKPWRSLVARGAWRFKMTPKLEEGIRERFNKPGEVKVLYGYTKDYFPMIIAEAERQLAGRWTYRCLAFDPWTHDFLNEINITPMRGKETYEVQLPGGALSMPPQRQGLGYAAALVEHTIAFSKKHGIHPIVPHVGNPWMKNFYINQLGASALGEGVEWTPEALERANPRVLRRSKVLSFNPGG